MPVFQRFVILNVKTSIGGESFVDENDGGIFENVQFNFSFI